MTPLYTYNNKLLLTQGKLSTSNDCCCSSSSSSSVECDCTDYPLFKTLAAEVMAAMEADGWTVKCCDGECELDGNGIQLRTEYCLGCPEEFCAIGQYPEGSGPGANLIDYFGTTDVGGQQDLLPPFSINELGFMIVNTDGGIEGEPPGTFLVARVLEPVPL